MSLLRVPPPNNGTSAKPSQKREALWQEFVQSWKRLVSSWYFWPLLLLVELIVPVFYRQGALTYNIYLAVSGLAVTLLLISLAAICRSGLRRVQYYLKLPQKHSQLSDRYDELERSIPDIIDTARRTTARQLVALASLPQPSDEIPVAGISEQHGTVHLLLGLPAAPETFMGMRLTVSPRADGAAWGVVEITRIDGNMGYAAPVNRVNPDFWEHLEERMRRDPSPPDGVVVKTEMHEVFAKLKRALREEEVTNNE